MRRHYCNGFFAREWQVGPLVIQVAHAAPRFRFCKFQVGRLLVWLDRA